MEGRQRQTTSRGRRGGGGALVIRPRFYRFPRRRGLRPQSPPTPISDVTGLMSTQLHRWTTRSWPCPAPPPPPWVILVVISQLASPPHSDCLPASITTVRAHHRSPSHTSLPSFTGIALTVRPAPKPRSRPWAQGAAGKAEGVVRLVVGGEH